MWRYEKRGWLRTHLITNRRYVLSADVAEFNRRLASDEFAGRVANLSNVVSAGAAFVGPVRHASVAFSSKLRVDCINLTPGMETLFHITLVTLRVTPVILFVASATLHVTSEFFPVTPGFFLS